MAERGSYKAKVSGSIPDRSTMNTEDFIRQQVLIYWLHCKQNLTAENLFYFKFWRDLLNQQTLVAKSP